MARKPLTNSALAHAAIESFLMTLLIHVSVFSIVIAGHVLATLITGGALTSLLNPVTYAPISDMVVVFLGFWAFIFVFALDELSWQPTV